MDHSRSDDVCDVSLFKLTDCLSVSVCLLLKKTNRQVALPTVHSACTYRTRIVFFLINTLIMIWHYLWAEFLDLCELPMVVAI